MKRFDYRSLSDEDLMRQFCLGDSAAFEELYRRHSSRIYGFLKTRLKDQFLVEDVFQETFLKLYKHRTRYSSDFPFLPWFFTLCRNTMLDALRAKKSREELLISAEMDSFMANVSLSPAISQDYTNYLDSLSQRERIILELHFIQDLPFKAVAGKLGLSGSTVRKISSRAIGKLRSFWKE